MYRQLKEQLAKGFIGVNALLAVAAIFLIFIFVVKEALPLFYSAEAQKEAGLGILFLPQNYSSGSFIWQPVSEVPKYSILPLLVGSLKATIVAVVVALPLGVAAAIYTVEFAPKALKEIIKPVIEMLAGIPSVVLGFFALIVMASFLQEIFNFTYRLNALNAGLALGVAVVPIIFTVAEDALNSVPRSFREASVAMGATSWQTAWRVVIPSALPGIFGAFVLGFGRAIGETMIVLMASGNAAINSLNFTDSVRTLSATIASELAEVVFGSPHYNVLFFLGAFLFAITFISNFFGQLLISWLQTRLGGEQS